nr:hypothetical protein [uncultured Butyrivibrio sp.]
MKKFIFKSMRVVVGLIAMLCLMAGFTTTAFASDQLTGSFQTVSKDVTAYEKPDTSASKTTISAGEMVLVAEEENGWIHIMHQGNDLYVQKADSAAIGVLENEAASEELEKRAQTDKAWIESYVAQMRAARSAMVWRIAIVVIIVVAVVLIVVTSIKKNSADKKEESVKE